MINLFFFVLYVVCKANYTHCLSLLIYIFLLLIGSPFTVARSKPRGSSISCSKLPIQGLIFFFFETLIFFFWNTSRSNLIFNIEYNIEVHIYLFSLLKVWYFCVQNTIILRKFKMIYLLSSGNIFKEKMLLRWIFKIKFKK